MHHKLHFNGWTRSLADSVSAYLLPDGPGTPFSLRDTIVVVPTAQAGRRLRRAIAMRSNQFNTGVLMGPVVTPFRLLSVDENARPALSAVEETAVWIDVLSPERCRQLTSLFPQIPTSIDFAWRRKAVKLLTNVRSQLAESGLTPANVSESEHVHPAEKNRWRDVVTLESIVRQRFSEMGSADPIDQQLSRAASMPPPPGISRIVLAACPDLAPLLKNLLARWSETIQIDVFIHAPSELAKAFDEWGCPDAHVWQKEIFIDLEHDHAQLCVADTPKDQADVVRSALIQHKEWAESGAFAIGVPDDSVTSYVVTALEEMGCPCFDPSGIPHRHHPIIRFLKSWRDLVSQRRYSSLREFVRLANVQQFIERLFSLDGAALLVELDNAQNECLPGTVDDVAVFVSKNKHAYPLLHQFLPELTEWLKDDRGLSPDSILKLLGQIYRNNMLVPGRPDDDAFMEVARALVDAGEQVSTIERRHPGITSTDWIDLLLEGSESRSYYLDNRQNAVELEGWLELSWNSAPLLIVTGMNEGSVPDSGFDDLFLPDSVREKLGLRCDASRCARDAYLLCALSESRRNDGHLVLISGRQNDRKDVLKPSRLFWRCSDEVMIKRAKQFFATNQPVTFTPERSFSLLLNTSPPDEQALARLRRTTWRVTDFSAYLKCPFRYYLQRILEMDPLVDDKEELDQMDFGNVVHHALKVFGRDESTRQLRDAGKISAYLESIAREDMHRIYGVRPSLVVELQFQSAIQRLKALAAIHVQDLENGWSLVEAERSFATKIGSVEIRGTIDRIDRHADGRYRVLDYKTSDNAKNTPEKNHLISPRDIDERTYVQVYHQGKKQKQPVLRHWSDLQLPLYVHFMRQEFGQDITVEAGYVQLTKAVSDINISMWEGLDKTLVESAVNCAAGIISDANRGIFWPPLVESARDTFDERWWPDYLKQVQPPVIEVRT